MNFKEEYLFAKYKNTNIKNSEEFRYKIVKSKFKDLEDVDVSELYKRIVNYQVKKYGGTLSVTDKGDMLPSTLKERCGSRKSARRKKLGLNGTVKERRWTV